MAYFGAKSPEGIVGKQFTSPLSLGTSRAGIGLLASSRRTPVLPTAPANLIFERAATALGKLEMPDYSDLNPIAVLAAFERVFDCGKTLSKPRRLPGSRSSSKLGWGVNPEWYRWFCDRVSQISKGGVSIRHINCRDGEWGISCTGHGPQCTYEELIAVGRSGNKLRFNLGFGDTYAIYPVRWGECPVVVLRSEF